MNNPVIVNINIDLIIPNRFQPRLVFDEKSLNELAESIKNHGIIQPLVLRKVADKYEIIAGERRYKASLIAGLTEVPAIIVNYDDKESAEVAIIENIQRKDLNSIEEAKSYQKMLDKQDITQEELASKLGISQSSVANKIRLLSLPEDIQKALMEDKISERHARSLLQVTNRDRQLELLEKTISDRLTVRELDELIKNDNVKEDITVNSIDTDNLEVFDLAETTPKKPLDFFNIFKQENESYSSLDDEVTNMKTGFDDYFNPFINDEETIEPIIETVEEPQEEVKEEEKVDLSKLDNIKEAYNNLLTEIKNAGADITSEEYDFEDLYQLIIKINKQ